MYYKEGILCLMFAIADADGKIDNDELVTIVTMKNVFPNYHEANIISLYKDFQQRFAEQTFSEIVITMLQQVPEELHMATLSLLADIAVVDFDIDKKESASLSIVANAMGVSDVALKTVLLVSLSKKLLQDMGSK